MGSQGLGLVKEASEDVPEDADRQLVVQTGKTLEPGVQTRLRDELAEDVAVVEPAGLAGYEDVAVVGPAGLAGYEDVAVVGPAGRADYEDVPVVGPAGLADYEDIPVVGPARLVGYEDAEVEGMTETVGALVCEVVIGVEDLGAEEKAEDDAPVKEIAEIEGLAYAVEYGLEQHVAGLERINEEASGHEQVADSVFEFAHGANLPAELAAGDKVEPGFHLGQASQPEDTEAVHAVQKKKLAVELALDSGLGIGSALVLEDGVQPGPGEGVGHALELPHASRIGPAAAPPEIGVEAEHEPGSVPAPVPGEVPD